MPNLKLLVIVSILSVSGCSLAPVYHPPVVPLAQNFKESGYWRLAHPSDQAQRSDWWRNAGDPELSELEERLNADNPDLKVALARYDEANAYLIQSRSYLFPQLGAVGEIANNRQSNNRPLRGSGQPDVYGADTVGLQLDYDLDLWGRVRNEVAANQALSQASDADLASVKLSLEETLANTYFELRGDDEKLQLLRDSESAYQHALNVTTALFHGGIASAEDMTRAGTNLYQARAQISEVEAQRALSEHALASLVGVPASSFSVEPDAKPMRFDTIPMQVPSDLLQRRPDIAAAERRMAAENAKIGVARAAFFPSIEIAPVAGFQDTTTSGWLSSPNLFWALGPTVSAPIFDAGLHQARLAAARAEFDAAAATYRSTVLHAIQQVEDNLALLDHLRAEAKSEDMAVQDAQRTLTLAFNQYQAGAVSYLDVFEAQTAALQVSQNAIDLRTRYLRACVGLVGALGGGWSRDDLGMVEPPRKKSLS